MNCKNRNNKHKYLCGSAKRKLKRKKDEEKNLLRGSLSKFLVQPFLDENSKENANVDLNSYLSTSDANFSEKENTRTDSNYPVSPLPFLNEARDDDTNIESLSGNYY